MAAGDRRHETAVARLLGEDGTNQRLIGCTAGGDLFTFAHATVEENTDVLTNDSDKTITIPANEIWWIHAIRVGYDSTGTGGNRQLRIVCTGASGAIVYQMDAGAVQAASLSFVYAFLPGVARETTVVSLTLLIPLPPRLLLGPAGSIRLFDTAAVDAAADDMTIRLSNTRYDV